jgi:hypothetical protein
LRRYLERQVSRPWDKVYSEIAECLRVDSTVQQHVRDHLHDFVAIKPRRVARWYRGGTLWCQPLYVDPVSGLLCRTEDLPEERQRRRAERNRAAAPVERIELADDSELRLISGLWYHVRLAPLPEPVYHVFREVRTRFRNGYSRLGGTFEVELNVRRLVSPNVLDVVTREWIAPGPAIDSPEEWKAYLRDHPRRTYAVAKRVLSRRELRRFRLRNPYSEV